MTTEITIRPYDIDQEVDAAGSTLPKWAREALEFIQTAADSGQTITVAALEETLTPAQMAADIGISRAGIQRRIASGEIAYRKVGNRYRIPRSEVERFREKYVQDLTAVLANDF